MRKALGVKGLQTTSVVTHAPSTIDQNQLLTFRVPKLDVNDYIMPGSVRLAFNISLTSGDGTADNNRTIVNNLGRAIIKKIALKLDGKDVYDLDNADRYLCFKDLWLTDKERINANYQRIQNTNTGKIRVGAANAATTKQPDASIAATYGNRFFIPLDFEMLTDHMPFLPSRPG